MQKIATVTAPTSFAATAANSLYGLLTALGTFVPTGSILSDRCCGLRITTAAANTGTVQLLDSTNNGGPLSTASTFTVMYDKQFSRNIIQLRDIFPLGSAASQTLSVIIDYE